MDRVTVVVCAALVREVRQVAADAGWDVDVHPLPTHHHVRPSALAPAVDAKLDELGDSDDRVVVYGDCGSAGGIDAVLARHGVCRPRGPHCYAMLLGEQYDAVTAAHPRAYFVTPWLLRNWDRMIVRPLALDRDPTLAAEYFAGVDVVVYLRAEADPSLEERARAAAETLGKPLEIVDVDLADFRTAIEDALAARVDRGSPC
jgi:hypothetical protein